MDLVRIISVDVLLNCILPKTGERSSFIFRDPRNYRDIPVEMGGDSNEQNTIGENFVSTTENNFLVSCWHSLECFSVAEFFDMHEGDAKVAIVSSVEAVEKLGKTLFEHYQKKGLLQEFRHCKVHYYDLGQASRPTDQALPGYCLDAAFRKAKVYKNHNYEREQEYRFAYRMSSSAQIERIVFYVNPREYLSKIYLSPVPQEVIHQVWSHLNCWDIRFTDSSGKLAEICLRP